MGVPYPFFPSAGNAQALRNCIFLFLLFFRLLLIAQSGSLDSLQLLPEVVVHEQHNLEASDLTQATVELDQVKGGQYYSLGEALEDQGLLFIKGYGLGSLATANVRGAAASQTTISWNGIPIQSPMLGLLDLSLLPAVHADEVGLDYQGAIGGNIFINASLPDSSLKVQDGFSIGSFGQFRKTLAVSGGGRLRFKLSTQLDRATNNFPYRVRPDLPEKLQSNAALRQQVAQGSFFWRIHPRQQLELHLWQQNTHRELPPTSVQTRSEASQDDRVYRNQLRWQLVSQRAVWQTAIAYLQEEIFYADPAILLEAPSDFRSWIINTNREASIGQNWRINSMLRLQHANALANGYPERQSQALVLLQQEAEHQINAILRLSAKAKLQWTEDQSEAFGGRLSLIAEQPKWQWQVGIQRDYRIPTLNDLFWVPGGNPALQPERAWAQDVSLSREWSPSGTQLHLSLFNRLVTNWIQWAQRDEQLFWSAQNITEVWSRGAHLRWTQDIPNSLCQVRIKANYQWTRSTFQSPVANPSIERGEQLWYTPVHQASLQLEGSSGKFSWLLGHRYVSATSGINDDLEQYQLGRFQLNWQPSTNITGSVYLRIENMWNENYRVIERRPMPGRQWSLGYHCSFHSS